LIHSESEGYLSANLKYEHEFPEIYIHKYTGKVKEEKKSISSLWEVEIADATCGMGGNIDV
jgi:hypothetical protein